MATRERRSFGAIDKVKHGFRAYYRDPDRRSVVTKSGNVRPLRHWAPRTFSAREYAEDWLRDERRLIDRGEWTSPETRRHAALEAEASRLPSFADYALRWIDSRKVKGQPLADRTKDAYRDYVCRFLEPAFGTLPLDGITPAMVNAWYDTLTPQRPGRQDTGEAQRAKVYSFARAVMNTAVSAHGPMPGAMNPFAVRGGGSAPFKRRDKNIVTAAEFDVMLATMRDDRRLMLLLALWCGLRYSEIAELRRGDIDLKAAVVKVRRAVSRSREGGVRPKAPKSDAGQRDQDIPPHILPDLKHHLNTHMTGRDGLLFPGSDGGHLAPATFYGKPTGNGWYAARNAAGRPDVRFHDLRATGATLRAQRGADGAEVQAFLGDSTPQAAARYVRAARSRLVAQAAQMSELAERGDW